MHPRLNVFPILAFGVGYPEFIYKWFIIHLKCPEEILIKNVSVSALLRFEKEQNRSLVIQALSIPTRNACSAQLNDNARSECNLTDEQMLMFYKLIMREA